MAEPASRAAADRRIPTGPLRRAIWLLRGMLGEHAYASYVAHHEREHPGTPPMSEREFWRQKATDDEANPQARCC